MKPLDHPPHGERLKKLLTEDSSIPAYTVWYSSRIDSTNQFLQTLVDTGNHLAITEYQTKGRGRHGNQWHSPPKKNLLFSLKLPNYFINPQVEDISPTVAALVVSAIHATIDPTPLSCPLTVKAPNDIVTDQPDPKKLAGILIETDRFPDGRNPFHWIVGIGVNIDHAPPDLPATSIAQLVAPAPHHPDTPLALTLCVAITKIMSVYFLAPSRCAAAD